MKTKLLLIALLALSLQACVPVVLVAAGATAGGAIVYDNRSVKTMAEDREITFRAQSRLDQDPQLKNTSHVVAVCFNHILLLIGEAPTPELSQHAYSLVTTNLPHVKRTYNQITIANPTTEKQRMKDTWITTKVKTDMLAAKGLQSTQIKVVTEDNVVYLLGLVTHSQGTLAADVASRVGDVQRVVKLFEYLH
jgi:osmotically-inducible protein OsmY